MSKKTVTYRFHSENGIVIAAGVAQMDVASVLDALGNNIWKLVSIRALVFQQATSVYLNLGTRDFQLDDFNTSFPIVICDPNDSLLDVPIVREDGSTALFKIHTNIAGLVNIKVSMKFERYDLE